MRIRTLFLALLPGITGCHDAPIEPKSVEAKPIVHNWAEIGSPQSLAKTPPEGFRHRSGWAVNHFLPRTAVQVGDYILRDVYIGSDLDFERYEDSFLKYGAYRSPPPFLLEFVAAKNAKLVLTRNDVVRKPDISLAATAYDVIDAHDRGDGQQHIYRFVGTDPRLGEVRFEATEYFAPPGHRPPPQNDLPGGSLDDFLQSALQAGDKIQHFQMGTSWIIDPNPPPPPPGYLLHRKKP